MELVKVPTEQIRNKIYCDGYDQIMRDLELTDPNLVPWKATSQLDLIDRLLTALETWHQQKETICESRATQRLNDLLGHYRFSPEFKSIQDEWIDGRPQWEQPKEEVNVIDDNDIGEPVKEIRREGQRILKSGTNVYVQLKRCKGTRKDQGYVVECYGNGYVKVNLDGFGEPMTVPVDEFVVARQGTTKR